MILGCLYESIGGPRKVLLVTDGNAESMGLLSTLHKAAEAKGFEISVLVRGKRPGKIAYLVRVFARTIDVFFSPNIYTEMSSNKQDAERFFDKTFDVKNPSTLFEDWISSKWGEFDLIIHDSDRSHLKKISSHPLMRGRNIIFKSKESKKYDFLFGKFNCAICIDSKTLGDRTIHPESFAQWTLFRTYMAFLKKTHLTQDALSIASILFTPLNDLSRFASPSGKRTLRISGDPDPDLFYQSHMAALIALTTRPEPQSESGSISDMYSVCSDCESYC